MLHCQSVRNTSVIQDLPFYRPRQRGRRLNFLSLTSVINACLRPKRQTVDNLLSDRLLLLGSRRHPFRRCPSPRIKHAYRSAEVERFLASKRCVFLTGRVPFPVPHLAENVEGTSNLPRDGCVRITGCRTHTPSARLRHLTRRPVLRSVIVRQVAADCVSLRFSAHAGKRTAVQHEFAVSGQIVFILAMPGVKMLPFRRENITLHFIAVHKYLYNVWCINQSMCWTVDCQVSTLALRQDA
jgi:hypothetical protein